MDICDRCNDISDIECEFCQELLCNFHASLHLDQAGHAPEEDEALGLWDEFSQEEINEMIL